MSTRITATELARNLSDILNRVRYRGESFSVVKNGELIAEIAPSVAKKFTVRDFIEVMERAPKPDPDYWKDVEEAHRLMNQPVQEPPSWDS